VHVSSNAAPSCQTDDAAAMHGVRVTEKRRDDDANRHGGARCAMA
jgi:hypothetical protein